MGFAIDFSTFKSVVLGHRNAEDLCTCLLVIVTVSLCFNYVLVASKGITIIDVTELLDEVVHDLVVLELLLINHVSLLLDDVIETKTIRELELVIVVVVLGEDTLLLNKGGILSSILLPRILLLIVNLLHSLLQLLLSQMREQPARHETISLASLREGVVPELLEAVLELLVLALLGLTLDGVVRVLRGWVYLVDEVGLEVVRSHVSLVLVVLGRSSVEVTGERALLNGPSFLES